MFDKLRIKMTLVNVLVTMTLFGILIAGVYILLSYNSERGCNFVLSRIAEKVEASTLDDLPARTITANPKDFPGFLPPPPRHIFFFVKVDPAGDIVKYSSGTPLSKEELAGLIKVTGEAKLARDEITFNDTSFAYLRRPFADSSATLFVFSDLTEEIATMKTLLLNLLFVGIFCSFLSFIVSFFMAKHAIKPIKYALTQQKNFVSDASHELRTPITIIQTNLDIINGTPSGDTIENNQKWLNNIQDETSRMTELINTLLFLARADANQQLLEKEYFSLNQTIMQAISPLQLIAQNKGIDLSSTIKGTFTAMGDPLRLKQALTILLDNALRHTASQGKITVDCTTADNYFYIRVIDTGEGIAAEHLTKVFDRFYQADSSRNKGGTGLGLPMAKWIIEKHNGKITIDSILDQGTTVTIKLPFPSE